MSVSRVILVVVSVVAVAIVSFSEREEPSDGMFVLSGYAKPVLEATS